MNKLDAFPITKKWPAQHPDRIQLYSLNTPNGITVPILKLDPVWDPLRNDPRFQALVDKYGRAT